MVPFQFWDIQKARGIREGRLGVLPPRLEESVAGKGLSPVRGLAARNRISSINGTSSVNRIASAGRIPIAIKVAIATRVPIARRIPIASRISIADGISGTKGTILRKIECRKCGVRIGKNAEQGARAAGKTPRLSGSQKFRVRRTGNRSDLRTIPGSLPICAHSHHRLLKPGLNSRKSRKWAL